MRRCPSRSPLFAAAAIAACLATIPGCDANTGESTSDTGVPKLNLAVCRELEPTVRLRLRAAGAPDSPLHIHSSGTPRLSSCSFAAKGAQVSVSPDTATDANQRISNRLVEIIQFDDNDPPPPAPTCRGRPTGCFGTAPPPSRSGPM